jgi:hypothetical protein
VSAEIARIRHFVSGQLGTLRDSIRTSVTLAKAELQKHITGIRMVPQIEGKKRFYIAEGEWNLLGGYGEDAGNSPTPNIRMVAGGSFTPNVLMLPFRVELLRPIQNRAA